LAVDEIKPIYRPQTRNSEHSHELKNEIYCNKLHKKNQLLLGLSILSISCPDLAHVVR